MTAKSWKGVWGNLKFLVGYKAWATLIVFGAGVLLGSYVF